LLDKNNNFTLVYNFGKYIFCNDEF